MDDIEHPPGAPLARPRHERFCQAYVRGPAAGNASAAYRAAGFTSEGRHARRGACAMLKRPNVRARIAHLRAALAEVEEAAMTRAAERLALSKEAVLAQHARIGFANMADYIRYDEHGRFVVDLANVERDRMAGIVELVVTERGEGASRVSTVRIKLGERLGALTNLGKYFGLFIEKMEANHDALRNLTDDELRQRANELQRKLGLAGSAGAEQDVRGDVAPQGEGEA